MQKDKPVVSCFQWDVTGSKLQQCPNTFVKPDVQKSNHLSTLQWTDWLCCGELLHSELVATADLLRRVHAQQPGHATSSRLPGV